MSNKGTHGPPEGRETMEDRQPSPVRETEIQTGRIEPILDASGTLRRVPHDTWKTGTAGDFHSGRQPSHPAR